MSVRLTSLGLMSAALLGLLPAIGEEAGARFMGFNIWGDFFKNPPEEREAAILGTIRAANPDLLALQEMTPNWWKGGLVPALERDGLAVAERKGDRRGFTPLLYRTARYRLIDAGFDAFHQRLDPSKGMAWAVFEDRRTGKGLIAFASHFWWQENGKESDALRETNARLLLWRLHDLKRRHPYAAIGGGDLNTCPKSWAMDAFEADGIFSAAAVAETASPLSSYHGDPVRDETGRYRGTLRKEDNTPATSLDHVLVETNGIRAVRHAIVTDQAALDSSDHSPVVVDFIIR